MEKITTEQIINAIKRNIWLLLVPALLIGGLVFASEFLSGGTYEANAVLMVTSNDDDPISYNKLILNERLANVYAQFLDSDDLYKEVAAELKGAKIDPSAIAKRLDFDVNPQGGTIALSYKDTDKARAADTLTLITEKFRAYADKLLNMENIDYLQTVTVGEAGKVRGLIFTILGLILGLIIGLIIMILREILTDKIHSADDIRQLGIEVLADIKNDDSVEYAKVRRKIETAGPKAVVGLTPLTAAKEMDDMVFKLAKLMAAPVIDPAKVKEGKEGLMGIKYKLNKYGQDYPYILVNEKSAADPLSLEMAGLEDYKILIAGGSKLNKASLKKQIAEFERLGIKVLGVIYY